MAGECPHSPRTPCHQGPQLDVANHEAYLKLISDLKNDLEQISCDMIMVQKECGDHRPENVVFENSLKELESQNDRLQQALQLQAQAQTATFTDLQTNNEALKCQNDRLQRLLFERDQHIGSLTGMLKNMSPLPTTEPKQVALECASFHNSFIAELEKKVDTLSEKLEQSRRQEQFLHRETRKLTDELNESKKINREQISQAQRLAGLLKSQESIRMELVTKYEALEQNYEHQEKKLRTSAHQLSMLEEKFHTMQVRQSEHSMECKLLREEVLSLKEKLADATGRQKSMHDQLRKTEKELYNAHEVIKEQSNIMQRNECNQNEEKRRWQEAHVQLKEKLAETTKQHQKLQEEHEQQKVLNVNQLELLENFRKWKDQQLEAEQSTRDELQKYQDIIRNMLEEKQKLLANMHDICKDYSLLQNELDVLKLCPSSLPHCNSVLNSSERSIPKIFELVRRTTRRVSEQTTYFKDEEPNATRDDTSSTYRPGEEPI